MPASPSLEEVLDTAIPFALPLHQPFRGLTRREGVLIEGPSGWGEFAPFANYDDDAAARWLASALEAAWGAWPAALRAQVPVNAILPEVDAALAGEWTRAAVLEQGCRTIKVKVGSARLADDDDRVAEIRLVLDTLLGPGVGRIRIDANARWDLARAREALGVLSAHGLEYVEQPCPGADQLRALRSVTDVPIAADELIRGRGRESVVVREVADIAILKPAPLGGVEAALDLAADLDMPVVISGSLDSSVGLATSLAAAAALPALSHDCGLGTGALLADDLCAPLVPRGGSLPVVRPVPDAMALERASRLLTDDEASAWRRRLSTAWAALDRERLLP